MMVLRQMPGSVRDAGRSDSGCPECVLQQSKAGGFLFVEAGRRAPNAGRDMDFPRGLLGGFLSRIARDVHMCFPNRHAAAFGPDAFLRVGGLGSGFGGLRRYRGLKARLNFAGFQIE